MSRYDTRLADERGAVRSSMSPNRNDYWSAADYSRDYHPREMHYWRRPSQLRGDVRGGSAFTYGFGNDYDRVYRGGFDGYDRGMRDGYDRGLQPRSERDVRRRPAGFWGGWLGGEGYPGGRGPMRYGYDFRDWSHAGRDAYDRSYREMGWIGDRY